MFFINTKNSGYANPLQGTWLAIADDEFWDSNLAIFKKEMKYFFRNKLV